MGRAGAKAERIARDTHFDLDLTGLSGDYATNEAVYLAQASETHRKKFAQFFTPQPIAEMMCQWILAGQPQTILDPAVGAGVFPAAIRSRTSETELTLVDLDPLVLKIARRTVGEQRAEYLNADFLQLDPARTFDAVIANPPYLRHHDFSYSEDIFEVIGDRIGIRLSKLTNLYGLFVLEIVRRLNPGGRAAIIIPTEWTNANFGSALKHFLLDEGVLNTLIYFSHDSLPFTDALTTASVLLIEKPPAGSVQSAVRTIYLERLLSQTELAQLVEGSSTEMRGVVAQQVEVERLRHTKKWDHLIKTPDLREKLTAHHLRDFAKTKRGIATGANEFFHLSSSDAIASGLSQKVLAPCIGRAADVKGLCFREEDFDALVAEQRRTYLVRLEGELGPRELAYVAEGERQGLNSRYLLAARKSWYQMENRPAAPIWAAVFGRSGLRFVRNKTKVLNLTAFHCVYPSSDDDAFLDALAVCLNSRLVQAESAREQRVYGGGLLKAEPKDLLDMWVPPLEAFDPEIVARIAAYLPIVDAQVRCAGAIEESTLDDIDNVLRHGLQSSSHSAKKDLLENLAFDF